MKNCPILLREQALNVIKDKTEITTEQKILKKLLYYMDCYCEELKMTELDILLNDKNYQIFYSICDSVMMKNYFVEA